MFSSLLSLLTLSTLLIPSLSAPLSKRSGGEIVQGSLGTDEYWNIYDGGLNNYVLYTGNGSSTTTPSNNTNSTTSWPSQLQWISFNDMWVANQHVITRSCNMYYNTTNVSDEELQDLYDAIQTASNHTRVDHRFILAIVMQETKGCVRAATTVSPDGTVTNPGLLQDSDGTYTCNAGPGKIQTPCPRDQIIGMVDDGTAGTSKGTGLAWAVDMQGTLSNIEYAQAYYRAARFYNSGMIDGSGDLEKGTATHCYASDIANRMTGWVDAPTKCTLDSTSS